MATTAPAERRTGRTSSPVRKYQALAAWGKSAAEALAAASPGGDR